MEKPPEVIDGKHIKTAEIMKAIDTLSKTQLEREKGFVTQEDLKKANEENEKRILSQVPLRDRSLPEGRGNDRKVLNDKLKFILNQPPRHFDREAAKALSVSIGAQGGFIVPEEFRNELIKEANKLNIMRSNSRVLTGVSKKGSIPKLTGRVSAFFEIESPPVPKKSTDPTFGKVLWSCEKLKCLTSIPIELVNSAAFDIVGMIAEEFGVAQAEKEDLVFGNGSGSGLPLGLRNASGVFSQAQVGANLDITDLTSLKYALPAKYRKGSAWIMHNDIIGLISELKDGAGRHFFLDNAYFPENKNDPENSVGRFLGFPVLELESMPVDLGGGSNESEIWLGSLQRYNIFDEGIYELSTTTEGMGAFAADEIGMKLLSFVDGKLALPEGFVFMSAVK